MLGVKMMIKEGLRCLWKKTGWVSVCLLSLTVIVAICMFFVLIQWNPEPSIFIEPVNQQNMTDVTEALLNEPCFKFAISGWIVEEIDIIDKRTIDMLYYPYSVKNMPELFEGQYVLFIKLLNETSPESCVGRDLSTHPSFLKETYWENRTNGCVFYDVLTHQIVFDLSKIKIVCPQLNETVIL